MPPAPLDSAPITLAATLSLCTAVLGLFMALPLIALGRKRSSSTWLGLFVLSLALLCLADYCGASGLYRRYPQLRGLFDWPVAAIGTFFYCYVRSMTGLGNGWRQLWLFLPLAAWMALLLRARLSGALGLPFAPLLLFFQLQAFACAVAVLYRLQHYRRRVRNNYSSTDGRDLAWLAWLSGVMMVLLCIWVPAILLNGIWGWLLLFGRIVVLYFVGWYGMRQPAVFLPVAVSGALPAVATAPPATPNAAGSDSAAAAPAAAEKYARSGMTEAARQLIGDRLLRRSEQQRDYLDSDIRLVDLAERIGTSPQLLSQYLNDVLGVSFFDYINGLRIAEVQAMMTDSAFADRPLQDLALQCGFNSRSTFNSAFKKQCGMTPSTWRKQQGWLSEPVG